MIPVLLIVGYLFVGAIAGGAVSYGMRTDPDESDRQFMSVLTVLLWPLFGVIVALYWIAKGAEHGCYRLGRAYGHRKYRVKVSREIIRQMEADLARVGGNQELALRWDYKACGRCFGSGCKQCSNTGVERVNVA